MPQQLLKSPEGPQILTVSWDFSQPVKGIFSRPSAESTLHGKLTTGADDATIDASLCAKIAWMPSPLTNNVTVSDGIVHLWGFVASEGERQALLVAAQRTLGVKEVLDHREDLMPICG